MIARRPALLLAAVAVVFALGADDAKKDAKEAKQNAAKTPSSWYARSLVQSDAGIIVWDYWSKGRKLRAETIVGGTPIVTFVSGEFYTIADMVTRRGVAIRRAPAALAEDQKRPNERAFGREGEDVVAKGAELVRSENLSGRPTRLYRLTDDRGKTEVWVTDDKRKLPVRVAFFARDSGQQSTTDYIDWIADMELGDAFFEPDPRVELERVEYADYVARTGSGNLVGPAPVLFSNLLHGEKGPAPAAP
jgi:outer membrane lipoprotein-sorting protein